MHNPESSDNHHHSVHHSQHHESITGVVVLVFFALCILTCASLLTYTRFWQERVPMEVGRLVMMAVSVTKAVLVITFFMHLWWETKWKYVVTIPAVCVSMLLGVALIPDIGKRTEQYDNLRLLSAPEPLPYRVGAEHQVRPALGAMPQSHEASKRH